MPTSFSTSNASDDNPLGNGLSARLICLVKTMPRTVLRTAACVIFLAVSAAGLGPPPRYRRPRHTTLQRTAVVSRALGKEYDLAVLGAGVTGVTGALKAAADYGKSVIVIDDPGDGAKIQTGGPSGLFSKALRDVSKRLNINTLRSMGMLDSAIWAQVKALTTEISLVETQSTVRSLQKYGVQRIQGKAALDGLRDDRVRIKCRMRDGSDLDVCAAKVLVATGSQAWPAPGIPLDGRRTFDSDTIRKLSFLPKSMVRLDEGGVGPTF